MGKVGFGDKNEKISVLKRAFVSKGKSQNFYIFAPPITIANHEFYIPSQKQSHYLSCNQDREGWCATCMKGLTNGRLVNRVLLPVARAYSYVGKTDNKQKDGVEITFLPIKSQAVQTGLLKGISNVTDPSLANYDEWVGVEIEVSRSTDERSPGSGDFVSVVKKHGPEIFEKMKQKYPHLVIPKITANNIEKYATTILSNAGIEGYLSWLGIGGSPSTPPQQGYTPPQNDGNPFAPPQSQPASPQNNEISDDDIPF